MEAIGGHFEISVSLDIEQCNFIGVRTSSSNKKGKTAELPFSGSVSNLSTSLNNTQS
jgi:hypothetical protein